MIEKREKKENDNEQIDKAFAILSQLISQHPEIEGTIWICAMVDHVASSFKVSKGSHDDFKNEMEKSVLGYKKYWNEN